MIGEHWIVGGAYDGHCGPGGLWSWRKRVAGWRRVYRRADDRPAVLRDLAARYDGGSCSRKVQPLWAQEYARSYGVQTWQCRTRRVIDRTIGPPMAGKA